MDFTLCLFTAKPRIRLNKRGSPLSFDLARQTMLGPDHHQQSYFTVDATGAVSLTLEPPATVDPMTLPPFPEDTPSESSSTNGAAAASSSTAAAFTTFDDRDIPLIPEEGMVIEGPATGAPQYEITDAYTVPPAPYLNLLVAALRCSTPSLTVDGATRLVHYAWPHFDTLLYGLRGCLMYHGLAHLAGAPSQRTTNRAWRLALQEAHDYNNAIPTNLPAPPELEPTDLGRLYSPNLTNFPGHRRFRLTPFLYNLNPLEPAYIPPDGQARAWELEGVTEDDAMAATYADPAVHPVQRRGIAPGGYNNPPFVPPNVYLGSVFPYDDSERSADRSHSYSTRLTDTESAPARATRSQHVQHFYTLETAEEMDLGEDGAGAGSGSPEY